MKKSKAKKITDQKIMKFMKFTKMVKMKKWFIPPSPKKVFKIMNRRKHISR
jgi:hypothetical protein